MANVLTTNPWKLDTTGAITTDRVRVKRILWNNPTDATHTLIIKDKNGNVVYSRNATAVGVDDVDVEVAECAGQEWNGITLDTIGSGAVYLTYE